MKKILFIYLVLLTNAYSTTMCVAHRGNNKNFLENTYSSIKSAVELGSDGVEFDVVHTKDGKALVFHDKDLKRLAKSKKNKVCNLTKNINRQYYIEIKNNCLLRNNDDIPTLESILKYLSNKDIIKFIELKDTPSLHTLNLIKKYSLNNPSNLRVISFKRKILDYIKLMNSELPILKRIQLLRLYRYLIHKKTKYLPNLHYSERGLRKLLKYFPRKDIGVWTVDDPDIMKLLAKEELGYITTNDPKTCLELTRNI